MGARTKSIPRARTTARPPRHQGGGIRDLVIQLRSENERLSEDCDHWHKRYFLRHKEAQKLEGLVGLRDARIAELELELAKKKAHIDKLEKKVFGPTSI